jgi:SAM-dependent methyltransferase
MRAYKTVRDLPAVRRCKALVGNLLIVLLPALTFSVNARPFSQPHNFCGRLIRNSLQHRAVRRRDHVVLQRFLLDYWASPIADEFFQSFAGRFEDLFLVYHSEIVSELTRRIGEDAGTESVRLVELGCGDGRVLDYLEKKLPQVSAFTGLDLSAAIIATCRERYQGNARLNFQTSDVNVWLSEQGEHPLVFFTNGGVLEYFTREQLKALFQKLAEMTPNAWVAITETSAVDHDLEHEPESFPYGRELAFSHNYPTILQECGFVLEWAHDRPTKPGEENHPTRWFQLIATTTSKPIL